jgi:hypothetical protein
LQHIRHCRCFLRSHGHCASLPSVSAPWLAKQGFLFIRSMTSGGGTSMCPKEQAKPRSCGCPQGCLHPPTGKLYVCVVKRGRHCLYWPTGKVCACIENRRRGCLEWLAEKLDGLHHTALRVSWGSVSAFLSPGASAFGMLHSDGAARLCSLYHYSIA